MSLENNEQDEENECNICYTNKNIKDIKCKTCYFSMCLECFYKITIDNFDTNERKMKMDFKCPVCRENFIYSYEDFNKENAIKIANSHLYQSNKFFEIKHSLKYNQELEKVNEKNRKLESEILKLKELIKSKDETHKNQLTLLCSFINNQTSNIKNLCELTKAKTINKQNLKPLYENNIIFSINT